MKGERCPYKDIICQEGYCDECQIFWDREAKYVTELYLTMKGKENGANNE